MIGFTWCQKKHIQNTWSLEENLCRLAWNEEREAIADFNEISGPVMNYSVPASLKYATIYATLIIYLIVMF